MKESNMPATEAETVETNMVNYELAFHVLPTVAEGEVTRVVDNLKTLIKNTGGSITGEESPARFELAYEIVKYLEGKNRKFKSAYFGWVRFSAEPKAVEELNSEVEGIKELLRYMIIRLTKLEEENPFYFHEALASKQVETVDEAADDDDESVEDDEEDVSDDVSEGADDTDGDEDSEDKD